MDNNKGPFSWLKMMLTKEGNPDKKSGKYQYMLLVLCIGAAFMLVGSVLFNNNSPAPDIPTMKADKEESTDVPTFGLKKNTNNKVISDYEEKYERVLKKALEEMLGEEVLVVVTIDSTEKQVLEKNKVTKNQTTEETDREGGQRKVQESSSDDQIVIIRNGEKEVPIVLETKKPEIRGILVVARGAENIQVKKWVIEAVTRSLGVPSHRVAVVPVIPKK